MASASDEFGTGWQQWNLQAWYDFAVVKLMMSKVGDVIPKTYLPILRLVSEDSAAVDDAYARLIAQREPVAWLDSPRDKWRKIYGGYIRELEWVYGELRNHFPTKEYQDLVTDIMARAIRSAMSAFLPSLEKMTRTPSSASVSAAASEPGRSSDGQSGALEKIFKGRLGKWVFAHLNPMGFMVGPVELDVRPGGEIEMFIPRCWMHTAPGGNRTHDQACVQGCKGACERVFNGRTPVAMNFEPHLPDFSCTLRVKLGSEILPSA